MPPGRFRGLSLPAVVAGVVEGAAPAAVATGRVGAFSDPALVVERRDGDTGEFVHEFIQSC
jgi:hypothetical protein